MAEETPIETKAERRARRAAELAAAEATATGTEATEAPVAAEAVVAEAEAPVIEATEATAPEDVVTEAAPSEASPETTEAEVSVVEATEEPVAAEAEAEATEAEVEAEVEVVAEATETVPGELLELGGFRGDVIGSGSFVGAKAKALLEAVSHETATELDYVVIATSKVNGVERAVLVSPALFQKLNEIATYSAVTKPVAWAVGGVSFSRDALFAGRVAYAITDARVGRVESAAALAQGVTRVYGYIVSAADFADSFAH